MMDVTFRSTRYLFIAIIAGLFVVTFVLADLSGIGSANALVWSVFGILAIWYPGELVPVSVAANSSLLLIADGIIAVDFVILTAFMTATFYSFISNINLRQRSIMRRVRRLRNHVIVTPFNGFADSVIREFGKSGVDCVVITGNERDARHLYSRSIPAVVGNPGNVELLEAIGLHRAMGVVLASDSTTENALSAVAIKTFNKHVKMVARVTSEEDLPKLSRAGVHAVILPEVSAGTYLGNSILEKVSMA